MTFSYSSNTNQATPVFETLLETLDSAPQRSRAQNDPKRAHAQNDDDVPAAILNYRESPDGSVTMGTDPLTSQVVLIVQNGDQHWEIALPPKIARFATSESQNSLAAAKQVADAAFRAYHARCPD